MDWHVGRVLLTRLSPWPVLSLRCWHGAVEEVTDSQVKRAQYMQCWINTLRGNKFDVIIINLVAYWEMFAAWDECPLCYACVCTNCVSPLFLQQFRKNTLYKGRTNAWSEWMDTDKKLLVHEYMLKFVQWYQVPAPPPPSMSFEASARRGARSA